ncbi:hypothetical protein JXB31_00915 [Candidatus Woesearchaeota archaeon]|nr:hypothetical protein [Candidatus Woesearchaeota archaeon]
MNKKLISCFIGATAVVGSFLIGYDSIKPGNAVDNIKPLEEMVTKESQERCPGMAGGCYSTGSIMSLKEELFRHPHYYRQDIIDITALGIRTYPSDVLAKGVEGCVDYLAGKAERYTEHAGDDKR